MSGPELDRLRAYAAARGLTIGAPQSWTSERAVDGAAVRAAVWDEGYFTTGPTIPAALIARCRDAIELVRSAGAPPLAAFVFDALWEVSTLLGDHATAAFGGPARLLPAFWAWRLEPDDARGWDPHRDRGSPAIDDRGRPEAIATWIPLTDATVDNGCMYVVPAPWDPLYPNPDASAEVMFLQAIRALPAAAGSVLGWTSRLLHWGAMARPGSPPRMSLSFELQDAALPPFDGEMFEIGWIPPVARRKELIASQWERYRHIHRGTDERHAALLAVVDRLLADVRSAPRAC